MTAIKYDTIYQVECTVNRRDCVDKMRHLRRGDIQGFRWLIDVFKEAGDISGLWHVQFVDKTAEDSKFWLRLTMLAMITGHATVDLHIYTDSSRKHWVYHELCDNIETIPCWSVTGVTLYEGIQTMHFTTK